MRVRTTTCGSGALLSPLVVQHAVSVRLASSSRVFISSHLCVVGAGARGILVGLGGNGVDLGGVGIRFGICLAALAIMTVSVLSFASLYMLFMFIGVAMHYRYAGHIGRIEAGLLAVLIAAAFWKASTMSGNPEIVTRSYMAALVVFLAAFLVGKHWPRTRVLSFLADISYPLYVVHGVAGYALMAHLLSHGVNPYLVLVMVTAAAIGMAWVLHVLVEIPAQRLGHRLAARLQDKPAADIEFQKTV